MSEILLLMFSLMCIGFILWGVKVQGRVYQLPFLAGATFASFIIPQLIGLLGQEESLPEGSLPKTIIMCALSLAMIHIGYRKGGGKKLSPMVMFNPKRLQAGALVLTLVGVYFYYKIGTLPEELTGGQWSGIAVALRFFAALLPYGFAISMLMFINNGSRTSLFIACLGLLAYGNRIFLAGRRADALELAMILLTLVWFTRRRAIHPLLMLSGIFLGTLFLFSTGEYRDKVAAAKKVNIMDISSIPLVKNFRDVLRDGGPEVKNLAHLIYAVERDNSYDYGAFNYNTLVSNYVPAQIVGKEFKESLMVRPAEVDLSQFGYGVLTGTTMTGMGDAFQSFWFFGCIKYFIVAYIIRILWDRASEGRLVSQIFYALLIVPAMHTITHQTQYFFSPWVHMLLFLFPVLWFSSTRSYLESGETFARVGEAANMTHGVKSS